MGHSLFIIAAADCCFRNLENPGCTGVFIISFVTSFQHQKTMLEKDGLFTIRYSDIFLTKN